MSYTRTCRKVVYAVLAAGLWVPLGADRTLRAEDPPAEDRMAAELAAGEFSAVRQRAEALDPAARDDALADLAVAQANASVPLGAAESLRAIGSRAVRQRALESLHASAGPPSASGSAVGSSGGSSVENLAGGSMADFDSLIQLIQSTVAPTTWDVTGGPGSISPFPTGVYVDTSGVMHRIDASQEPTDSLGHAFDAGRPSASGRIATDVRIESPLRYVSLPRLEREIELRLLTGQPIDESMRVLAGLRRVRHVFVYPETGDIVLAGPAGDWREEDGRVVSMATGEPVALLEDLIVLMRRARAAGGAFGCAIKPKQENLARTQEYLTATTARPLRPGERRRWIEGIRKALGRQEIEIFGLDPETRVARVLVEADYHMKLIGMGLAEGVLGVESYLDTVPLGPKNPAPPMSVLRWWFTLNYDSVATSREGLAFEVRGPGVRVLSENELLTARGERVHTGTSDELTARFAASFTRHFDKLAAKYPIYAELRNLFDLALVVALFEEHGLYDRVGWRAAALLNPRRVRIAPVAPPREVDSVVNHRVEAGRYILVGVSGGVSADPSEMVRADALKIDEYGDLQERRRPVPADLNRAAWWWDGGRELVSK